MTIDRAGKVAASAAATSTLIANRNISMSIS
jgi:hypothetical protein